LLALRAHHILHVGRIRVNAVAVDKGSFIHSHNLVKFKSHIHLLALGAHHILYVGRIRVKRIKCTG
jgi:hypothetical protein